MEALGECGLPEATPPSEVHTLMRLCAIAGVMLTQRVKQSLASDTLPSRSNCRPLLRLASLRLPSAAATIRKAALVAKGANWMLLVLQCGY